MAFKIQIINNALEISDTVSGEILITQPSRDSWFTEESLDKDLVLFYGTTSTNEDNIKKYKQNDRSFKGFPIADCVTFSDVTFTKETFRNFCYENLSFNAASGSGANEIFVTQKNVAETLGGTIDSTRRYRVVENVDMGLIQCTVPATNLTIIGNGANVSSLYSSEDNYTMFINEVGGCGDLIHGEFRLKVTGANSSVYALTSADGLSVIDSNRLIWDNCTSLGYLDGFAQGVESTTTREMGTPELEFRGDWAAGYVVNVSNTIVLGDGDYSLYKAGAGFVMNGRFDTNQSMDLPTNASFFDFSDANFPNPSTLELRDVFVTRNGVVSPNDANITPNIEASNLSCSWKGNNGVANTFVGGILAVSTEVLTGIIAVNVPSILAAVWRSADLQHFDVPSAGQLRHLGDNPREYTCPFSFVIEGSRDREFRIDLIKNSGGALSTVESQKRTINSLSGPRDVAYFNGLFNVILNKNEFVYWQIANLTDSSNCTMEVDSSYSVQER